jgi:hypothetical protein
MYKFFPITQIAKLIFPAFRVQFFDDAYERELGQTATEA